MESSQLQKTATAIYLFLAAMSQVQAHLVCKDILNYAMLKFSCVIL
jgi:hypothetical protein